MYRCNLFSEHLHCIDVQVSFVCVFLKHLQCIDVQVQPVSFLNIYNVLMYR